MSGTDAEPAEAGTDAGVTLGPGAFTFVPELFVEATGPGEVGLGVGADELHAATRTSGISRRTAWLYTLESHAHETAASV
jgi:hypothetical protein